MLSYCTILCAVYPNSGRKHGAGCSPFVCSLKAKEMDSSVHLKYRGESHTAVPWQTSRLSCCGAVFCFNCSSLVLKALSSLNVWGVGLLESFSFLFPPRPSKSVVVVALDISMPLGKINFAFPSSTLMELVKPAILKLYNNIRAGTLGQLLGMVFTFSSSWGTFNWY